MRLKFLDNLPMTLLLESDEIPWHMVTLRWGIARFISIHHSRWMNVTGVRSWPFGQG